MAAQHDIRRSWRMAWLQAIREFANLDEQRRTWLNPENSNPHFSFVEWMCSYFDDLALSEPGSYADRTAEGLLGQEEARAVEQFHLSASAYVAPGGDDYDHEAILDDPAWRLVVADAQAAKERLLDIILEPDELRHLSARASVEGLRASRTAGNA